MRDALPTITNAQSITESTRMLPRQLKSLRFAMAILKMIAGPELTLASANG